MSKPTKFGSNRLTNRDQSCGPMLKVRFLLLRTLCFQPLV